MSYVKHILLPGEQIVYDGHVHPKVLMPGAVLLGLAAWILTESSSTGGGHSFLFGFTHWLAAAMPFTSGLYLKLVQWQQATPNIALEIKILTLALASYGFSRLMQGLLLMQNTELIVTDRRIIAKSGIMTVTTVEMDRRRVSGVIIQQTILGRVMGYGHIYIQGFTSSIGGLPVMVNPRMVEKFVS